MADNARLSVGYQGSVFCFNRGIKHTGNTNHFIETSETLSLYLERAERQKLSLRSSKAAAENKDRSSTSGPRK